MSILGGVDGDWGPDTWTDPTGTTANNGPQVQTNSVIAGSTSSQGQDRWSGMLQTFAQQAGSIFLQSQAAKAGLAQTTAANGQPVYVPTNQAPVVSSAGITSGGILLIAAAIAGAVLLVKAEG